MNFLIITHVIHTKKSNDFFAYSPYVNEMNIWLKHVDKVTIIAPLKNRNIDAIHQKYNHNNINFIEVPQFSFINFKESSKAIFIIPYLVMKILKSMIFANHIHLRCPGNMGLLGSFAQIFFPLKSKSVKYAGNWDPKSKQPLSYRLQKKIISSAFLSHNIKVLVYGKWINQSKNIIPFFTATYFENEILQLPAKNLKGPINFIFVGTLSQGKQPLYAVKIIEKLLSQFKNINLSIYGDGEQKQFIFDYIDNNNLENIIHLKGNKSREEMKLIYQKAHFLILPSKSEGWPKVIAEAMFWSCLPISNPVSCVSNMLDNGKRGILLSQNIDSDVQLISGILKNDAQYGRMINEAKKWSQDYTIDFFENEIIKIIKT